jgi:hypothetical protein
MDIRDFPAIEEPRMDPGRILLLSFIADGRMVYDPARNALGIFLALITHYFQ